jgi:hypothetical protein
MAENGVKIVRMKDGDILRVAPGTDTGDLEVLSDGDEGEPQVVKTSQAREQAEKAAPKTEKKSSEKK